MIEEFDGSTPVSATLPHKVPAWVQIHRVPHLYRSEAVLKLLAGKIGETITIETRAIAAQKGDFHRVRVNLEANCPLVRFVTMQPEGRESLVIQIMYEKIPKHCAHCGLMGHKHLERGSGEYN
jgi:hypothetical protein